MTATSPWFDALYWLEVYANTGDELALKRSEKNFAQYAVLLEDGWL